MKKYERIENALTNQSQNAYNEQAYGKAKKLIKIMIKLQAGAKLIKSQKLALLDAVQAERLSNWYHLKSCYDAGQLNEFQTNHFRNAWEENEFSMSSEASEAVKIRQESIGVEPVQAIKTGDSLLVLEKFISSKPSPAYGEYMTVDGFIGTVYKLADGRFYDYMSTNELDKHFADSPLRTPSISSDRADKQACIRLARLNSPLTYLTSNGDYNRAKKALIDYAKSLTLNQQQRLDSMLNEYLPIDGAEISSTLSLKSLFKK